MRFTGISAVSLPQVRNFSFLITGIKAKDTGAMNFKFYDTGGNSFGFDFASGFIQTDKILSTYNTFDENTIYGYYSGGTLNCKVNNVYQQRTVTFSGLSALAIDAGLSGEIFADVFISSNPISYSVSFPDGYNYSGNLTGTIISDTAFPVKPPSFIFYSSNRDLLTNSYSTGFMVKSGATSISFADSDNTYIEYSNGFFLSLPTTFGDIGRKFSSRKTGVSSSAVMFLADASGNSYYQSSLFDGYWSGRSFTYTDNVLTYNLGFDYSHTSSVGIDYPSSMSIKFEPLGTFHGHPYTSKYITGFNLTNSGSYSGIPTFSGAQYYYVTGIRNSFQSFLFSSGCNSGYINVTFNGGNPVSNASGRLILKQIKISGIYDTGVAYFNMVSGYSGASDGYSYRSAPVFVLATGGGCYSLPDYSGVELYQFTKASGYGAIYAQAAGLTGVPVMGEIGNSGVSGVLLGNIGVGYDGSHLPTLKFIRPSGDNGTNDASGTFLFKTTGYYDFNGFWSIGYSTQSGIRPIPASVGYFQTGFGVLGAGTLRVQITCSGLDNTSAISGLLTVILSGQNGRSITGQRVVSQSRTFDTATGALLPASFPVSTIQPLPDLSYDIYDTQYDYQYISDGGVKLDTIINF